MAKPLDPFIVDVLKKFGFGKDAIWDCHGTLVVYHRILEQIAAKAGISFDLPLPLETSGAAKSVALCVRGTMAERSEWSIGEASPGNNKNSYPYAMAEKRAKDRVILKLIGLHGLVYSEEEADDFQQRKEVENQARALPAAEPAMRPVPKEQWHGPRNKTTLGNQIRDFGRDLEACSDLDEMESLIATSEDLLDQCSKDWPACWLGHDDYRGLKNRIAERRKELSELPANPLAAA